MISEQLIFFIFSILSLPSSASTTVVSTGNRYRHKFRLWWIIVLWCLHVTLWCSYIGIRNHERLHPTHKRLKGSIPTLTWITLYFSIFLIHQNLTLYTITQHACTNTSHVVRSYTWFNVFYLTPTFPLVVYNINK